MCLDNTYGVPSPRNLVPKIDTNLSGAGDVALDAMSYVSSPLPLASNKQNPTRNVRLNISLCLNL